jgi:hypothetical protein
MRSKDGATPRARSVSVDAVAIYPVSGSDQARHAQGELRFNHRVVFPPTDRASPARISLALAHNTGHPDPRCIRADKPNTVAAEGSFALH